MPWAEKDLIYFAGFFDGEGCISLCKNKLRNTSTCKKSDGGSYHPQRKTPEYYLEVCIINTDRKIINWIKDIFGGSTDIRYPKLNKNQKDAFRWRASRKNQKEILQAIFPFLKIKKEQANIALEYLKIPSQKGFLKERENFYQKMRTLNKRGIY